MSVNLAIVEKLIFSDPAFAKDKNNMEELPIEIANWPEDWREEFEERTAIMTEDSGLPCAEAEQWAETIVRAFYRQHGANKAHQPVIDSGQ